MTIAKQKHEPLQHDPTPRFEYEGDVHPITGERVFRTDAEGLRAAYRAIMRWNPNHPALENEKLWKGAACKE